MMIGLYDRPGGTLILDATTRATQARISKTEHGCAELRLTIPMALREAAALYNRGQPLHAVVAGDGATWWEGRTEELGLASADDSTALTLTAYGYWQALKDLRASVVWSATSLDGWRPVTTQEFANRHDQRFAFDTANRLLISLDKNATYLGTTGGYSIGALLYRLPAGTRRLLTTLAFDYQAVLPVGWIMRATTANYFATDEVVPWAVNATGALQTGSVNVSFAGKDSITFDIFNNNAAAETFAGETGDRYLRITNLRITSSATPIDASAIARDLVAFTSGSNPTQLASSTALIQANGTDLSDAAWLDTAPADILTELAQAGDTSGRLWEVGVAIGQRLYARPRLSRARDWYVDASGIDVERALDGLINSAYAVYEDANGGRAATAAATTPASIRRHGLTRQASYAVQTTSAVQAGRVVTAALADGATPPARASITVGAVYTGTGARVPLLQVEPGDRMTIRNLPVDLGAGLNRVRTFRISRTEYDALTGALTIEPEEPLATVDALLAGR